MLYLNVLMLTTELVRSQETYHSIQINSNVTSSKCDNENTGCNVISQCATTLFLNSETMYSNFEPNIDTNNGNNATTVDGELIVSSAEIWDIGDPICKCPFCKPLMWYG